MTGDCPNIETSDDGTSFCRLAEQAWRDKDAEVAALPPLLAQSSPAALDKEGQ